MANANLTLLTTSNTFYDQMVQIDNLINGENELRNGVFYVKDNGSMLLLGGGFFSNSTVGTGLSIAANSVLGQTTTLDVMIATNNATILGNVVSLLGTGVILSVANSTYTNNLYANNATIGNAHFTGTQTSNSTSIELNAGASGGVSAYLEIYRGLINNPAFLQWNESEQVWTLSNVTSNVFSAILSTANLSNLSATLENYNELVTVVGSVNNPNTVVCNLANTNVFDITLANTLTHDTTISFIHPPAAGLAYPITLILRQSAVAPNTVTFSNTIHWSGNAIPVLSAGSSTLVDVISLITDDSGITYLGGASGGGGSTANAVANAANTTAVANNYGSFFYDKALQFVNSASMLITTVANSGNVDISFSTAANLASNTTNVTSGQAGTSNLPLPAVPYNNDANLVLCIRNGLVQAPYQYSVGAINANASYVTLGSPMIAGETIELRVIQMLAGGSSGGGGGGGGSGNITIQGNGGGFFAPVFTGNTINFVDNLQGSLTANISDPYDAGTVNVSFDLNLGGAASNGDMLFSNAGAFGTDSSFTYNVQYQTLYVDNLTTTTQLVAGDGFTVSYGATTIGLSSATAWVELNQINPPNEPCGIQFYIQGSPFSGIGIESNTGGSVLQGTNPFDTVISANANVVIGVNTQSVPALGIGNITCTISQNQVTVNGNIVATNATVNGVSFIPSWTAPTVNASYSGAVSGYNAVGFWTDPFGIVHLRGFIANGASNLTFTTIEGVNIITGLPIPPATIVFQPAAANATVTGTNYPTTVEGKIFTNGAFQIVANTSLLTGNLGYISLETITYSTH